MSSGASQLPVSPISVFSVQTRTALHAAAAGTVTGIETKYARDTFANDYGNYVRIAVDRRSPNRELLDLTYRHMATASTLLQATQLPAERASTTSSRTPWK
jgi:hypothetical protein